MSDGHSNPYVAWIARALWAFALLTIVVIVAGCVWALLIAADDQTGASGVKGVFLVTTTLWCLSFIAIVVLLAMNQIDRTDRTPTDPQQ